MSDRPPAGSRPAGSGPTGPTGPTEPTESTESTESTEAERRRRRAAVFGDVLPDRTRDERGDDDEQRRGEGDAGEEWLRRQVPPHHGG